jgi:uncharacterized protein YbjT (DUF2867 family)
VLAGASGELGQRIADCLLEYGATVKALVRPGSTSNLEGLREAGVQLITVNYNDRRALVAACTGSSCVVSALNGLEDVMIGIQTTLLEAAVEAGVPRFIPSDYCIDYQRTPPGSNRNLDLRREFASLLDTAPIRATSILNGMFSELLNGPAPVVLLPIRRIMYWGSPEQRLDFTTMDDAAEYTALAALDDDAPRYLRIAGSELNAHGLAEVASEVTGKKFRLLRAGGLRSFGLLIRLTRILTPQKGEVFPPWQGMQYLHNMFSGRGKLYPLDNGRYPWMKWKGVGEVLNTEAAISVHTPALPTRQMEEKPAIEPGSARIIELGSKQDGEKKEWRAESFSGLMAASLDNNDRQQKGEPREEQQ